MRAEETASVVLWCAMTFLPLLLIVLCGAVYATITSKKRGGQRPDEKR